MKKIIFLALSIAAFSVLRAQDTVKISELSAVQVVGTRTDSRTPVSMTKIACDSVQYLNTQSDLFFVLDKIAPSVYSQSDNGQGNGYSYTRMRGFDQTRINFNLNGVPLNEMEDQGIYFSNMPGFYNYISSMNVQRGIGSSKYGNSSIGGTVDMESKNMFKRAFQFRSTAYSNVRNRLVNGMYSSGELKDGLAFQLGGTYGENAGFKEHSGNEGGSVFYGAGYRNQTNIVKVYGFSGVSENQLAFKVAQKDSLDTNYQINLNSPNDKDHFNQNFIAGNWVSFKGAVKFNTTAYFNNVSGTYNVDGVDFGVNSHQYGLMTNMVYENEKRIFNVGVNTNIYDRKHFGYDNGGYYDSLQNCSKYENMGQKRDLSAYIKATEKLNSHFYLFCDAQVRQVCMNVFDTRYKDLVSLEMPSWSFFNPKIGLKQITSTNEMWFSLAFTQREPTRTDMFQQFIQQNNYQFANPDNVVLIKPSSTLRPEIVTDIELGNKRIWKNGYISGNFFYMKVENEFLSKGKIDDYSGFMWKLPVKSTIRYGIESDGAMTIRNFKFFYTFQHQFNSTEIDGEKRSITFSPNTIATVGSSFKRKRLALGAYCQYIGKMATSLEQNQAWSNSYFLINGFASYHFSNNLYFSVNVGNLANRKYYIPAGSFGGSPTYYAGQLLNWSLSVNYSL